MKHAKKTAGVPWTVEKLAAEKLKRRSQVYPGSRTGTAGPAYRGERMGGKKDLKWGNLLMLWKRGKD